MNVTECYSLHDIVRELELALQIEDGDLRESDIDRLLANIKKKIDRQYQVDVTNYKVDSAELELSNMQESAALFIENVAGIHSKLCGYCQIRRYLASSEVSLEDINYMGLTRQSLKANLQALQRL